MKCKLACVHKAALWKIRMTEKWLAPAVDLGIRLWMANVFWKSGLTKIANWDNTVFLFTYEYSVPLLPPEIAAYVATAGELVLPWLVAFGLAGRMGALGMFIMTLVIELFVYPGTTEHYYWMFMLGVIITRGPGLYSVDAWLRHRYKAGKFPCGGLAK